MGREDNMAASTAPPGAAGTAPAGGSLPGLARRLGLAGQGLRLQTLVRLRWLAVTGQTVAVLAVQFGLGFRLPLGACLAIIALSAWLNIFLTIRWRTSLRLEDRYAALLLGYDIVQLAGLLYLTGGLQNPFVFLFLVPVTVSASTLALTRTVGLGALTLGLITVLAFIHMPLPWYPDTRLVLPPLYAFGLWTALNCGLVFSIMYAYRVAREARQMSQALAATENVLAREQQLSALDGMAAAAAHELGTPLGTIALVAKELKRELPNADEFADDLDLLISQTRRCREILSRLSSHEARADAMFARVKVTVMAEDIAEPLRGGPVEIKVTPEPVGLTGRDRADEPLVVRNPGIAYGLGNILENAVDFAASHVSIDVTWTPAEIAIMVMDDGPGFAQEVIDRLGEPFVTTRAGYGPVAGPPAGNGREGMGLGFFIAKTLLERSGATVTLANRAQPHTGAMVSIAWPRHAIEAR
jgi:two-component system sensor histidine kinase RegB